MAPNVHLPLPVKTDDVHDEFSGSKVPSFVFERGAQLRMWPLVAIATVVIVCLGVLGVLHVHSPAHLRQFDLDGEINVPAGWSAALLVLAGGAALVNGAVRALGATWRWYVLGGLFLFMSLDEWASVHEYLEEHTHVDWQVLYLPVFLFAAIAALKLLPRLRSVALAAQVFVAGGAAWGIAQTLEHLEWSGNIKKAHYNPMMVAEELLEMTGSFLFLATGLIAFRAFCRRRASRTPYVGATPDLDVRSTDRSNA